jgi:outer membrane protein
MGKKSLVDGLFKAVVVLALVVLIFLQSRTHEQIVYVDSLKLLSQYKGMTAARKELDQKSKEWKTNLDTLRAEMEGIVAQLNQSKESQEKKRLQEAAQGKQQQFLAYQQTVKEQFQKEDQDLSAKVLGKVNDYIRRYGEEKGYAIVLVAVNGNIAYGDKGKDITQEVLVGLNREYRVN